MRLGIEDLRIIYIVEIDSESSARDGMKVFRNLIISWHWSVSDLETLLKTTY